MEDLAFDSKHGCRPRPEQAQGAVGDYFEYGLDVGLRLADDAQDLGGGRLLLQGLFCLVEESDILNRDDRLVGEGSKQRNLLVSEWFRFSTSDHDRSQRAAFSMHG